MVPACLPATSFQAFCRISGCWQIFAHNGTHLAVPQRSTAPRPTLDLECDESPNTRLRYLTLTEPMPMIPLIIMGQPLVVVCTMAATAIATAQRHRR